MELTEEVINRLEKPLWFTSLLAGKTCQKSDWVNTRSNSEEEICWDVAQGQ
jgi:hypothetical protein